MTKKFLTSVADVYAYDNNNEILFIGKTLLDSSIEVSLGSAPVRGGKGNQLQYVYYHTAEMNFTITDAQWNPFMLGETIGSDFELGNYYAEETVTVSSSGSGTISGTPLAYGTESSIYGWATDSNGRAQRVVFSGSDFSGVAYKTEEDISGEYCVRYYKANTSKGKQITVKANMLPSVVKLVLEAQLNSPDVTANKIGVVQIIAPKVVLSGGFSISMTPDGVSSTPLTGMALSYTPSPVAGEACTTDEIYAHIVEVIDDSNWYDDVYDLSVSGGDFSLSVGGTTTPTIYAVPDAGNAFKVPVSELLFASDDEAVATAGSWTGVVTGIAAGSATISVEARSASAVDTSAVVTVS